ncbi:AraC family transcriptional regulator [Burkholderia paludis]|uniref:AraC family transcriptional regulator n=1 Tax=Burkholderia paludis TaxID=1506587 RepID=UPI000946D2E7|nr:AraC family transcriptional regulator [Burkholderia paludis]
MPVPHSPLAASPSPRTRSLTTIGGYALAIAKALNRYGVDAGPIFRAFHVDTAIANDPMSRLPVDTVTRLYKACVDVTGDPYFGLTVARFIHISNLHALGFGLAASSTLMDFLKRVERYFKLASQVGEVALQQRDDEVVMRVEHLTTVCGETEDAFLGFLVLSMRMLHQQDFNPLHVAMRHPAPPQGDDAYVRLFRAPVTFDAPCSALTLPMSALQQPLAGACPELALHNDSLAREYLARLDKGDVVAATRQKIIEFLPTGECTRDRVAHAMLMSASTLQARLARHDRSFQSLLDETRKDLACQYVLQPIRSITEITFLLGFTDSSNFTRAFKRWTGHSPSDFRGNKAASQSTDEHAASAAERALTP